MSASYLCFKVESGLAQSAEGFVNLEKMAVRLEELGFADDVAARVHSTITLYRAADRRLGLLAQVFEAVEQFDAGYADLPSVVSVLAQYREGRR